MIIKKSNMREKVKLLIVDDDTIILKLMQNVLDKKEFHISTITDDENIINDIRKISPDIVLLDIKLPGTSGIETIHLIKNNDLIKSIPIIAFTSYNMKGDKEKFLKMGYDEYISKPFNTRTVSEQILKKVKK